MFKKQKEKEVLQTGNLEDIVHDRIRQILPSDIKHIELNNDVKIEDLGIDSLQYVNLIFSLEDIIGGDLEEIAEKVDVGSIRTIGDIVNLVKQFQS